MSSELERRLNQLGIDSKPFADLEEEFQKVIKELSGDASMERFRREFEKLHKALEDSNEREKELIKAAGKPQTLSCMRLLEWTRLRVSPKRVTTRSATSRRSWRTHRSTSELVKKLKRRLRKRRSLGSMNTERFFPDPSDVFSDFSEELNQDGSLIVSPKG